MKWQLLSPYFKFSVYSHWLLCIKLKHFEYSFSYNSAVWGLPGSQRKKSCCRLCQNYNSYSFHIHKILCILNGRKSFPKNVHRVRTYELILYICNIALIEMKPNRFCRVSCSSKCMCNITGCYTTVSHAVYHEGACFIFCNLFFWAGKFWVMSTCNWYWLLTHR